MLKLKSTKSHILSNLICLLQRVAFISIRSCLIIFFYCSKIKNNPHKVDIKLSAYERILILIILKLIKETFIFYK